MAFGDVKGTLTGTSASITNPFTATGSVSVSAGDLVYCVLTQQVDLTVTAVSDNLGNTYTACNAGVDAGNTSGRAFYSIVTNAGTLTTLSATCTASSWDVAFAGVAFEGPFAAIDANPANTSDTSSPFSCPATGTLAQADELVVNWHSHGTGTNFTATSPNVARVSVSVSTNIASQIGSWVVSSTSTVTPEWTSGSGSGNITLGTTTFKGSTTKTVSASAGNYGLTGTNSAAKYFHKAYPSEGAYGITGQVVSSYHNREIAIGGTSASALGLMLMLGAVAASGGTEEAYAIVGSDAGVVAGADKTAAADAGSYLHDGASAGMEAARSVASAEGVYVLGGLAATLRADKGIVLPDGAYIHAGASTGIKVGRVSSQSAGLYIHAGASTAINVGRVSSQSAGLYIITGTDANVLLGSEKVINAEEHNYIVDGQPTNIQRLMVSLTEEGDYALSGIATNALYARDIEATSNNYIFNGDIDHIAIWRTINALDGVYDIFGVDQGCRHIRVATPSIGAYNIIGNGVTLVENTQIIDAEHGNYTITGYELNIMRHGTSSNRRRYMTISTGPREKPLNGTRRIVTL